MNRPAPARPTQAEVAQIAARLQEAARVLSSSFLDKQEIVRLLLISAVAGEHMILVGPPGTAKSALIRTFAELCDARYFEYLLTRFTEPNELFGPVDIKQFRDGIYTRRTERMLPEAEIVFLDEIFKSNSAILNSLLSILNERRFANGAEIRRVPLISLFAASNEVPNDENLAAMFDRFLLRVVSDNLDSYHFHNLVQKGLENEIRRITSATGPGRTVVPVAMLQQIHSNFDRYLNFSEDFLAKYKGLIFQIRSEGITVSDRRVVKLLKLFAASALFEGRTEAADGDFFVLKHIWNNFDQAELLEEIVNPVVDLYYRDRPTERRFLGPQANLDDLLAELRLIRELLSGGSELSDIQLFSQLKNLNEIKAALQAIGNDTARRMLAEVDQLLETLFSSSKFGDNLGRVRRAVVFDDVLAVRGERFPGLPFPVEVHAHADEAELLDLGADDVVFMDFEMGAAHRDGAEAVAGLREAGFKGRIIAMSSDPGCNAKMLGAGADEALPKKAMLGSFLRALGKEA